MGKNRRTVSSLTELELLCSMIPGYDPAAVQFMQTARLVILDLDWRTTYWPISIGPCETAVSDSTVMHFKLYAAT